jgi:segregation and condensation protein B
MNQNNLSIIEALIFASETPLSAKKIREIIEESSEKQINEAVESINQRYSESGAPFKVIEVAGGFQMVTKEEYAGWVKKLFKSSSQARLTQKGLETLSIIAYKQPVTKLEIESIRGVNVDGIVKTLIERNLITVIGREKAPGNPLLYGTTNYFLEYFGLTQLSDLPKLKEIDELLKSDEKFLESLDSVNLEPLNPSDLGLTSMIKPDDKSTEEQKQSEASKNDTSE